MCYTSKYPCQAKHPDFLFISASPTSEQSVYGSSWETRISLRIVQNLRHSISRENRGPGVRRRMAGPASRTPNQG